MPGIVTTGPREAIHADESGPSPTSRPSARRPTWRWRAIEAVVVFGLDVDDPKAIQGTTRGLAGEVRPRAASSARRCPRTP